MNQNLHVKETVVLWNNVFHIITFQTVSENYVWYGNGLLGLERVLQVLVEALQTLRPHYDPILYEIDPNRTYRETFLQHHPFFVLDPAVHRSRQIFQWRNMAQQPCPRLLIRGLEFANQLLVVFLTLRLGQLQNVDQLGALQRLENVVNVIQPEQISGGQIAILLAFVDDGEVQFR